MKKAIWLLALPLLLAGCGQKTAKEAETPQKVETMVVTTQTTTITMRYPATMRGQQDIDIYPQIEGKITRVCVEEGQHVRQGQPLFIINQTGYRAALATAQANVLAARARVDNARLTLRSKQQLRSQKVVAAFTVDQAAIALRSARAELAQAEAEARNAANNLSYTIVRSPSTGVVGTLPLKVGSLVTPTMARPMTTVAQNAMMVAYFSLTEQQLLTLFRQYGGKEEALRRMPAVHWEASDGSVYEQAGRVVTISGILDPQTGSVSVRAAFSNSRGMLLSGAAGNVLMPMTIAHAVVIPQTVVSELQDKKIVYKKVNGTFKMTPITVYPVNDGKVYIVTSGLRAGDIIKK